MSDIITVDKAQLERAATDADFLEIIKQAYHNVWQAHPDKMFELLTEDQLSFFFYGILYDQVQNGGFLQLIFNGYAPYIFGSPLAQSLRNWGAALVAELLESIGDRCLEVAEELGREEQSLELLSASYGKYPEFEAHDQRFYANDGIPEVKAHIAANLSSFAAV